MRRDSTRPALLRRERRYIAYSHGSRTTRQGRNRAQVRVSAGFQAGRLDKDAANPYPRCFKFNHDIITASVMKIRNSLKSLKSRHRDCRVIRRRGRVYVINKTNRRFKARQG